MSSELYRWSELGQMPLPRAGCSVGVIAGKLCVAGGTFWQDGVKHWSDQVDCFDPNTGRWESQPRCPAPRGDGAAVVARNALYIFGGGADGPAERSVFVFTEGRWKTDTTMTLPEPRRSSVAVVLNDTFYVLGGLAGRGSDFGSATTTMYAARSGETWRACADIPGPPRFNAAVAAFEDRIIVAGGCTPVESGVRNLDSVLVYEPKLNVWSEHARLPFPFRGACGLRDGGRLLMFGGYTDDFLSCIQALDIATGAVSAVGQLPYALADTKFVWIGSSVWGVTGENGVRMRFPGILKAHIPPLLPPPLAP